MFKDFLSFYFIEKYKTGAKKMKISKRILFKGLMIGGYLLVFFILSSGILGIRADPPPPPYGQG